MAAEPGQGCEAGPLTGRGFCPRWWNVLEPRWRLHTLRTRQTPQAVMLRWLKWKIYVVLLRHFSCVWLCATPETAAHQTPPPPGFSRQEHRSGSPPPSPMHESEEWKWSRPVVSDSSRPHGLQPTRLLRPWDFPGKSAGVGCHCLLQGNVWENVKFSISILGIVWMLKPLSCFIF